MKKWYGFDSQIYPLRKQMDPYNDIVIKNEPMLFSCDKKTAHKLGGPITDNFLSLLEEYISEGDEDNYANNWDDYIIDSRVHMVFTEGIYCCIPGWHHDSVPRTRQDGQPDYQSHWTTIPHVLALVNADIAPTEFAIGEATYPDIEEGEKYYKKWHPIVEKYIEFGQLRREKVEDRKLYLFTSHSFHQGTPTIKTGWRFFIRAMRNNHGQKPANEVRKQVQVYLPEPMCGW